MENEKTLKPAEKTKKASAAKKSAETKAAAAVMGAAPAEKKVTEKKAAAEKKVTEKKAPAAKRTAAERKAPAEKKATRRSSAKKAVKTALTLDDLTTAVWQKIEKKDVKTIPCAIAIQVNVHDIGTFYIAVNADPEYDKQVIQADYYLADGIVEVNADEIKKIASGNYDFIAASKAGAFTYRGDLTKGILIAELLK